jgi:hypothetical protein
MSRPAITGSIALVLKPLLCAIDLDRRTDPAIRLGSGKIGRGPWTNPDYIPL